MVEILEVQMRDLNEKVSTWESQLSEARARGELAAAALQVNEQLALNDSASVTRLLDDMDADVDKAEAIAAAYRELAEEDRKDAAERALGHDAFGDAVGAGDSLDGLKVSLTTERDGADPSTPRPRRRR